MNETLQDRLRRAAKICGGIRALSEKSGIKERTLAHWLTGTEPKTQGIAAVAEAADVSLDWLITGKGEERPAANPIDLRLTEIDARLNQATVPMGEDDLRAAPEWLEIRDELRKISQSAEAGSLQRARADLMLQIAFSDEEATHRGEQRLADVGGRLRRSHHVYGVAIQAVGWEPPPIVGEVMRNMIFAYDMRVEDVVLLLEAIRRAADDSPEPSVAAASK